MLVLFTLALALYAIAYARTAVRPCEEPCELCFACRAMREVAPARVDATIMRLYGPVTR